MSALPNDLALTTIADGSAIVASPLRNNFTAIQAGFNLLRDALAGGTANQVVTVVDATHIALALLTNANVDPAAAIAYSKLALTGNIVNADVNAAAAIAYSKLNLAGSIVGSDLAPALATALQATPVNPSGTASGAGKMMGIFYGSTTATGVNALNSATVNVASALSFPPSGSFLMGGVLTTYTSITATSFTGCGNHAATTGGEAITGSFITPKSSRLFVSVSGDLNPGSASVLAQVHLRYGTGSCPANGAALTGTVIGNTNGHVANGSAGFQVPFTLSGLVTGLTPGTAVWVDLDVAADGNGGAAHTATVANLTVDAFDLI